MATNNKSSARVNTKAWLKNAGKSVVYSSFNVLKSVAPNMGATAISASDSAKDVRNFIASTRSSMRNQTRMFETSPTGRTVKDIYNSAIEDIRSGNFSLKRASDMAFDSFDDVDIKSLNLDDSSTDDSGSSPSEPSANTAVLGKTISAGNSASISAMQEMTNVIASSQIKSAKMMSAKSTDIALFGINKINTSLMGVNRRLDTINSNLVALIRFQNENVSVTNQAMLQYMDRFQTIFNRFDKTLDMKKEKTKRNTFSEVLSHGFNFKEYGSMAKKNFGNSLPGALLSMGKMMFDMSSMMGGSSNIRLPQMGMEALMKLMIPKGIKDSVGGLDKNFNRYIKSSLLRLGDMSDDYSKNPVLRFIGEIFGMKRTKSNNINMGNYNKDAMSWNGLAQKALVEVIPGTLARIEASLTKKSVQYYDYDTGQFKTKKQIRKQYQADMETDIQSEMYSSINKLTKYLDEKKNIDEVQMKLIEKQINSLIHERISKGTAYQGKYQKDINDVLGKNLTKSELREVILDLEDDIVKAMESINERKSKIEDDTEGAVYRNLFNKYGKKQDRYNKPVDLFGTRLNLGSLGDSIFGDEISPELIRKIQELRKAGASESEIKKVIDDYNKRNNIKASANDILNKVKKKIPWAERGKKVSGFADDINNRLFDLTMGYKSDKTEKSNKASSRANPTAKNKANTQKNAGVAITAAVNKFKKFSFKKQMDKSHSDIDKDIKDTSSLLDSEGRRIRRTSKNVNQRSSSVSTSNNQAIVSTEQGAIVEAMQEQSNSLGLMVHTCTSFLGSLTTGIFGKDGIIKKFLNNDHIKGLFNTIKEKLFNEEKGLFGNQVKKLKDVGDYVKYMFTGKGYTTRSGDKFDDSEDSVFKYLQSGYKSAFASTMRFMFNDEYKDNPWFQKLFSWADLDERKKKTTAAGSKKQSSNTTNSQKSLASGDTAEAVVEIPVIDEKGNTTHEKYDSNNDADAIHSVIQRNIANSAHTVSEKIKSTGDKLVTTLMGSDDKKSKADKGKSFLKKFRDNLPKALTAGVVGAGFTLATGGSLGLIGSLFLPGSPIGGAIAGIGIQLLSRSKTFQKFMFGEYDEKQQKRVGGILSQKMQDSFKKALPAIVGGAVLGGLKKAIFGGFKGTFSSPLGMLLNTLLPGGIVGGAMVGMASSLVLNSNTFQNILFGKKDEDGKRRNGLLAKAYNAFGNKNLKANKYLMGGLKGIGVGALTGLVLSKMGILGSALSLGGPIGMGIAGFSLGIATQTKRFQEYLFGTKEVGPDGKLTGKRNRDGLLSQVRNMFVTNVIDPLKKKTADTMTNFAIWAKKQILFPFKLAFGPIADSLMGLKDSIGDFVKEKISVLTDGIGAVLKASIKTIFKPVTKVIGFIGQTLISAVSLATKVALAPVTGTLKILSAITSPKRFFEEMAFKKNYGEAKKKDLDKKWAEEDAAGKYSGAFGSMNRMFGHAKDERELDKNRDYEDNARIAYNETLGYTGKNHFGWRNVTLEKREAKKFAKDQKADQQKWNNIYKAREKISNDDLGKEFLWSPSLLKKRRDKFIELGVDPEQIKTEKDVKDLVYRIDDWKDRYSGKAKDGINGVSGTETPEMKKARENTAAHQDIVDERLQTIIDIMRGKARERSDHINNRKSDKAKAADIKRLKKRLYKNGLSLEDLGIDEENYIDYSDVPEWQWAIYRASPEYASGDFKGWHKANKHNWTENSAKFQGTMPRNPSRKKYTGKKDPLEVIADKLDVANAYASGGLDKSTPHNKVNKDITKEVSKTGIANAVTSETEIAEKTSARFGGIFSKLFGKSKKQKALEDKKSKEAGESNDAKSLGGKVASVLLAGKVSSDDNDTDSPEPEKKESLFSKITGAVGNVFSGIAGWFSDSSNLTKIGVGAIIASIFSKQIGSVWTKYLEPNLDVFFGQTLPTAIESLGTYITEHKDSLGTAIVSFGQTFGSLIQAVGPGLISGIATNASALMKYIIPALGQVAGSAIMTVSDIIRQNLGFGAPSETPITPEQAAVLDAAGLNSHTTNNGELVQPGKNVYYDENNEAQVVKKHGVSARTKRMIFNGIKNPKTAKLAAEVATGLVTSPLRILPGGKIISGAVSKGAGDLIGGTANLARSGIDAVSGNISTAYKLARETGAGRIKSAFSVPKVLKETGTNVFDGAGNKFTKWLGKFWDKLKDAFESPKITKIVEEGATVSKKATKKKFFTTIKEVIEKVVKSFTPEQAAKASAKVADTTVAVAKGGSKLIPILGWVLVAYDVGTGMLEAEKLFGVNSDAVDIGMRVISGLLKGLLGLWIGPLIDILLELCSEFTGTDIKKNIATSLYDIFANDEAMDKIHAAQAVLDIETENYNNTNNTNLSTMAYKELKNQPWWQKAWNTVTGKGNFDFSQYEVGKYNPATAKKQAGYSFYKNGKSVGQGPGNRRKYNRNKPKYGSPMNMAGYTQDDPRWANYNLGFMPDGTPSTMDIGGCGPTALSNVASSITKRNINPLTVAKVAKAGGYLAEGGSSKDLFESGAKSFGLKSNTISKGSLDSALSSGNPVIISGKSGGGMSPYTEAGHIITASGLDSNGNTMVTDPMYDSPRKYNVDQLKSGMTSGWKFNRNSVGYGKLLKINGKSTGVLSAKGAVPYKKSEVLGSTPSSFWRGNNGSKYGKIKDEFTPINSSGTSVSQAYAKGTNGSFNGNISPTYLKTRENTPTILTTFKTKGEARIEAVRAFENAAKKITLNEGMTVEEFVIKIAYDTGLRYEDLLENGLPVFTRVSHRISAKELLDYAVKHAADTVTIWNIPALYAATPYNFISTWFKRYKPVAVGQPVLSEIYSNSKKYKTPQGTAISISAAKAIIDKLKFLGSLSPNDLSDPNRLIYQGAIFFSQYNPNWRDMAYRKSTVGGEGDDLASLAMGLSSVNGTSAIISPDIILGSWFKNNPDWYNSREGIVWDKMLDSNTGIQNYSRSYGADGKPLNVTSYASPKSGDFNTILGKLKKRIPVMLTGYKYTNSPFGESSYNVFDVDRDKTPTHSVLATYANNDYIAVSDPSKSTDNMNIYNKRAFVDLLGKSGNISPIVKAHSFATKDGKGIPSDSTFGSYELPKSSASVDDGTSMFGILSTLAANIAKAAGNFIKSKITGKPYESIWDADIADNSFNGTAGTNNNSSFNGTGKPSAYTPNFGTKADFFNSILSGAQANKTKHGVMPSLTLAHSAIESGYGQSGLTKKANNLFGIKTGSSWTGPFVTLGTKEYDSATDTWTSPSANFRKYDTLADSIDDYGKLLNYPRYAKVISAKSYPVADYEIMNAGYGTAPNYNLLLDKITEQYGLAGYNGTSVGLGLGKHRRYGAGGTYSDDALSGISDAISIVAGKGLEHSSSLFGAPVNSTPSTSYNNIETYGDSAGEPAAIVESAKKWFNSKLKTRVTSDYGYRLDPLTGRKAFHSGIDFANPGVEGKAIPTPVSGKVVLNKPASSLGAYGNHIVVKDRLGNYHLFGHMKSQSSKGVNSTVNKGATVGYVGTTGRSTGNHLHYEVRSGIKGPSIDPNLIEYAEIGGLGFNSTVKGKSGYMDISRNSIHETRQSVDDFEDMGGNTDTESNKKINVAVNTVGLENKMDILIMVMKEWAERDSKDSSVTNNNIISYINALQKKPSPPKTSTTKEQPTPDTPAQKTSLRDIHNLIAKGTRK